MGREFRKETPKAFSYVNTHLARLGMSYLSKWDTNFISLFGCARERAGVHPRMGYRIPAMEGTAVELIPMSLTIGPQALSGQVCYRWPLATNIWVNQIICNRVSQNWNCWHFGPDNSLLLGVVLCSGGCLTASQAYTSWIQYDPCPSVVVTNHVSRDHQIFHWEQHYFW